MAERYSRQQDEQLLRWLEMRSSGMRFREIARQENVSQGRVEGAVRRVRQADLDGPELVPCPCTT